MAEKITLEKAIELLGRANAFRNEIRQCELLIEALNNRVNELLVDVSKLHLEATEAINSIKEEESNAPSGSM